MNEYTGYLNTAAGRGSWVTPSGRVSGPVAGRALRTYRCRFCDAAPGSTCVSDTGKPAATHVDRIHQWNADGRPIKR